MNSMQKLTLFFTINYQIIAGKTHKMKKFH